MEEEINTPEEQPEVTENSVQQQLVADVDYIMMMEDL